MKLNDYIRPDNVAVDLNAVTKLHLFQLLAAKAALITKVPGDEIQRALLKREELGSTGIGHGVAIPHTRMGGIETPTAILVRLRQPIDFDSIDEAPVDIVLMLLTPTTEPNQHLNVLACFSRRLGAAGVLDRMRSATTAKALYDCIASKA